MRVLSLIQNMWRSLDTISVQSIIPLLHYLHQLSIGGIFASIFSLLQSLWSLNHCSSSLSRITSRQLMMAWALRSVTNCQSHLVKHFGDLPTEIQVHSSPFFYLGIKYIFCIRGDKNHFLCGITSFFCSFAIFHIHKVDGKQKWSPSFPPEAVFYIYI